MTADQLREALERWRCGFKPESDEMRRMAECDRLGILNMRQRPDGVWEMA